MNTQIISPQLSEADSQIQEQWDTAYEAALVEFAEHKFPRAMAVRAAWDAIKERGGKGSGNFGHGGLDGVWGGSSPSGGGSSSSGGGLANAKRVSVRGGGRKTSAVEGMPKGAQEKIVGWFATKQNMAQGHTVSELEPFEREWLEKLGEPTGNVFRASTDLGTTLVKFNFEKGTVAFADNRHLEETDRFKWEKGFKYNRFIVDEGSEYIFEDADLTQAKEDLFDEFYDTLSLADGTENNSEARMPEEQLTPVKESVEQEIAQDDSNQTNISVDSFERYLDNALTYANAGNAALTQESLTMASYHGEVPDEKIAELQEILTKNQGKPIFGEAPKIVGRGAFSKKADASPPPEMKERSDEEKPEWYMTRFWARYNEAIADRELLEQHGAGAQIERPEYRSSDEWNSYPTQEQTVGAEVARRQIRRNYFQLADEMVLDGWRPVAIENRTSGEIELRRFEEKDGERVLMRAILVRKKDNTEFYPVVKSSFLEGTLAAVLENDEVRL